jgi:hypothetical protein
MAFRRSCIDSEINESRAWFNPSDTWTGNPTCLEAGPTLTRKRGTLAHDCGWDLLSESSWQLAEGSKLHQLLWLGWDELVTA